MAYVTEDAERKPETPAEEEGTTGLFTALGKMLKRLRERAGLTQKQFGEIVGYGPDAISAMERGADHEARVASERGRNPQRGWIVD